MSESFDAEQLKSEACERIGLDDFGSGDWSEAMERLLEAAAREARLSETGRLLLRAQTLDRLVNRLEIQDWVSRHPEIHDQQVESPLILATLPRTGQTAAGWILDRDPRNRALLSWFVKRPCPPPLPGSNEGDPRLEKERAMAKVMPKELLALHLSDAEEPDECHFLISNGFKVPHEIYTMQVPSYYEWTRDEADMREAYQYYFLQLQILQSRDPGRRWVLKNSPHLLFLNELNSVMPDAIFVQFHRDPLKVLASNCRLSLLLRAMASDDVDPQEGGRSMLGLLGDYLDRLLLFRASGVSRPWIDLRFREFVADPVAQLLRVYEAADIEVDAQAHAQMAQWVSEHPRDDLSRARPADLSPFGIDPAEARERFAAYADAFAVDFDGI